MKQPIQEVIQKLENECDGVLVVNPKLVRQALIAADLDHEINWTQMLEGNPNDLVHDCLGICRYYDPITGDFTNGFYPRHGAG